MNSKTILATIAIWVPILNVALDMIMVLFEPLKSVIAVLRILMMTTVIVFYLRNFKWATSRLNFVLSTFLTFIFLACLLSSDLRESMVDGFLKMTITMLMLPIGIKVGATIRNSIVKPMFWVLVLLLINYSLSQVFRVGVSVYDENSFYKGGATASAPIIIALAVLVMMHSYAKNVVPYRKWIVALITILSIFVVIISVKRGAILALGISAFTYLFLSTVKTRMFRLIIVAGVVLSGLAVQYSSLIMARIDARTTEANTLENENRYKETIFLIEELNNASLSQIVFGHEPFHSQAVFKKYFGRERQLHIDYNIILHGSGLLGLALFLYFYFEIISIVSRAKDRIRKYFSQSSVLSIREDSALVFSLCILSLIMSFSGGIQFVSYRSILFLVIGIYVGQIFSAIDYEHRKVSSLNPVV